MVAEILHLMFFKIVAIHHLRSLTRNAWQSLAYSPFGIIV